MTITILLLRSSLLRFVDSNLPGNSSWAWEFHPLGIKILFQSNPMKPRILVRRLAIDSRDLVGTEIFSVGLKGAGSHKSENRFYTPPPPPPRGGYRGFCLNSSTSAVSKVTSRRWWCIERISPPSKRSQVVDAGKGSARLALLVISVSYVCSFPGLFIISVSYLLSCYFLLFGVRRGSLARSPVVVECSARFTVLSTRFTFSFFPFLYAVVLVLLVFVHSKHAFDDIHLARFIGGTPRINLAIHTLC